MALFGKKNNKNSPPQNASFNNQDEDIDLFSALEEEDLSASAYPSQSYSDFEGQDIDDDILGIGGDERPTQKQPEKKSKVGIIIAAIAVVLIGGGLIVATVTGDDQQPVDTTQEEDVDSSVEGSSEGIVVNEQLGVTYDGNDNGSPVNGTGAILAFDHAYYVDRNGEKVMEHFNPDVTSYDAAFIQSHIDKVPGGTTHKLEITPRQVGVSYDVTLTLNIPGEDPVQYLQNFEIMQDDGTYFVKTFTSSRVE